MLFQISYIDERGIVQQEDGAHPPRPQQKRPLLSHQQYLLSHSDKHNEAFEYFKQAEKAITEELRIDANNPKVNQLAGITYNNLACYYKK